MSRDKPLLKLCPTPGCTNYRLRGRKHCGPCTGEAVKRFGNETLEAESEPSVQQSENRKLALKFMLGRLFL